MKSQRVRLKDLSIPQRSFKEAFREQAKAHGVADYCVIDKDTYAEISEVSGCFEKDGQWIVYDVDERGRIYGEKSYTSEQLAYADLAGRMGFAYVAPEVVNSFSSIPVTIIMDVSASMQSSINEAQHKQTETSLETIEVELPVATTTNRMYRYRAMKPRRRVAAFMSKTNRRYCHHHKAAKPLFKKK